MSLLNAIQCYWTSYPILNSSLRFLLPYLQFFQNLSTLSTFLLVSNSIVIKKVVRSQSGLMPLYFSNLVVSKGYWRIVVNFVVAGGCCHESVWMHLIGRHFFGTSIAVGLLPYLDLESPFYLKQIEPQIQVFDVLLFQNLLSDNIFRHRSSHYYFHYKSYL